MEKIVLEKPGSLVLGTGPKPELSAGHALVRIPVSYTHVRAHET